MAELNDKQAKIVKGGLAGGSVIAAAIALAIPTIQKWEGTKLDPYKDVVGVWTVCTGETRIQMRRYTKAECDAMLADTVAKEWAPGVLKAVPGLKDRPYQLAASVSFSYNVGLRAFSRSSVARKFNAGDWRGGCNAMLAWDKAGGRVWPGLTKRRQDEQKLCLTGL